jgi:aryl-phospho-beta-D-glucosidase BglC (GH1 family)
VEAHTGQKGENKFFSDASNVALAVSDWRRIAAHFRSNPAVAGYDLINEPTGTPTSDTLYVVTDRLYNAVRSVDTRHMIFIEDGYTGIQWMPFPAPAGWDNVVYSTHYYDFNAKSETDQRTAFDNYLAGVEKERDRRNIPYNVGEFGFEPGGTSETLAYAFDAMQHQHVSWTMWTYKVLWPNGGKSLWALYCNAKPMTPLNFYTDSLSQLIAKCAAVRTENLDVHPGIQQQFRADASAAATATASAN